MHVIALVAREPDQAIGPVRLERDLQSLAIVRLKVVFGQVSQLVHNPPGTVVPQPARVRRLRRRRRRRRRRCGRWYAVNFDVGRKRVSQQKVEKIHVVR